MINFLLFARDFLFVVVSDYGFAACCEEWLSLSVSPAPSHWAAPLAPGATYLLDT
jgi:hypothetical protein